jgi:hypothetical protein
MQEIQVYHSPPLPWINEHPPWKVFKALKTSHPRSLQIVAVGGDRGEEEQPITQVGLVDNEIPNEVKTI